MRAFALALVIVSTPAATAEQQFDLICMFGKTEMRFRVDLAAGEACSEECSAVWPLGVVTAGEIVLRDTRGMPSEVPQTYVVNRQTGLLTHWIGRLNYTETATCTPAPFSGFPTARF